MSKLLQRIILILVSFPLIFALVFLLPHYRFMALNLTVAAATLLAALEVRNLLDRRGVPTSRFLAPILGASLPAGAYLAILGAFDASLITVWVALAVAILLARAALGGGKKGIAQILLLASSSLIVLLYPGLFLSFLVLMTEWDQASFKILFYFSLVFLNDMAAYAAGKLFGRKGNFIISPNKSLAGFAAGLVFSVLGASLFYLLLPDLFPISPIALLLFCALIGLATILGDLIESAFKRSADVKDSGTIMVGRGGMLDSVDSLLISAPLVYVFFGYLVG